MKEFEFRTTAKTSEEMVERLEAAIKMFRDGYLDARVFEDDDPCEGCHGCDKLNDLGRAIETMIYYDLPIPYHLTAEYNITLTEFYKEHGDEDKEEDD